jgi:hypothetical protein
VSRPDRKGKHFLCQTFNAADIEKAVDTNMGVVINYPLLFKTVNSYTPEQLQSMLIDISCEEKSHFKIITTNDKISLPHLVMTEDQLSEVSTLIDFSFDMRDEGNAFQLSLFNDGRKDFLNGISTCFPFLQDKDDRKNNAFALYNDKIVVNDRRHIFIYNLANPVTFLNDDMAISLHKKCARIFLSLNSRKIEFDAALSADQSKLYIVAGGFEAILNNAMSNILPPTKEELAEHKPMKAVYFVMASKLLETATFFNSFYTSAMEYKPLLITVETKGLRFTLRDSGVAGYNTCHVERFIPYDPVPEGVTEDRAIVSATIMNESFLKYLKEIEKEQLITIFMEEDKLAVYIQSDKKEIYLAKLTG